MAKSQVKPPTRSDKTNRLDRIQQERIASFSEKRWRDTSVQLSRDRGDRTKDGRSDGEKSGSEKRRSLKFIGLGELRRNVAFYVKLLQEKTIVLVRYGKPVAIIRHASENDFH